MSAVAEKTRAQAAAAVAKRQLVETAAARDVANRRAQDSEARSQDLHTRMQTMAEEKQRLLLKVRAAESEAAAAASLRAELQRSASSSSAEHDELLRERDSLRRTVSDHEAVS